MDNIKPPFGLFDRPFDLDPGDITVHKITYTDTHNIVLYDTDDVLFLQITSYPLGKQ